MKYSFLHERRPNLSLTRWFFCFSLILIQIKVIAQTLWVGRNFWKARFLQSAIKRRRQCYKCAQLVASIRINYFVRISKLKYYSETSL